MSENTPTPEVPEPNAPQGGATPPPPPPPGGYEQAPPPPPPAPGAVGGAVPVGAGGPGQLMDRFLAKLIDALIMVVVMFVITLIGVAITAGSGRFVSWFVGAIFTVITTALYLGYFAFMESNSGQTVGKMVLKLRVVGPNGGNPTLDQGIRRNIWAAASILGVIPIVGGIFGGILGLIAVIMIAVGINSDPVARQAWHDKFAGGTRVIKEG